jgi:hypothetical protein
VTAQRQGISLFEEPKEVPKRKKAGPPPKIGPYVPPSRLRSLEQRQDELWYDRCYSSDDNQSHKLRYAFLARRTAAKYRAIAKQRGLIE